MADSHSIESRFWLKVDKSGDCWIWTGSRLHKGYAHIRCDGRYQRVHRVSWCLANGPIPPGLKDLILRWRGEFIGSSPAARSERWIAAHRKCADELEAAVGSRLPYCEFVSLKGVASCGTHREALFHNGKFWKCQTGGSIFEFGTEFGSKVGSCLPPPELFARHVADENVSAHKALDVLGVPLTRDVVKRSGEGKQAITLGLAERIRRIPAIQADANTRAAQVTQQDSAAIEPARVGGSPLPGPPPQEQFDDEKT